METAREAASGRSRGEVSLNLLTIEEVAQLLNVSPVTVHRYKREKGLPYIKIGNTLRFDWEDVRRWVERHKRNATLSER